MLPRPRGGADGKGGPTGGRGNGGCGGGTVAPLPGNAGPQSLQDLTGYGPREKLSQPPEDEEEGGLAAAMGRLREKELPVDRQAGKS